MQDGRHREAIYLQPAVLTLKGDAYDLELKAHSNEASSLATNNASTRNQYRLYLGPLRVLEREPHCGGHTSMCLPPFPRSNAQVRGSCLMMTKHRAERNLKPPQ